MQYGHHEFAFAAPIADALIQNTDFRSWFLGRTKFSKDAKGARLLDREMLEKRTKGTSTWWRSHFQHRCHCPGCSGQETDLLAVFRSSDGLCFALHVEVKQPGDDFEPGQAAAYPIRAKCWSTLGRTPKRVLPHTDAATVIIFNESNRKKFADDISHFDTRITFEEIVTAFPNVLAIPGLNESDPRVEIGSK